MTDVLNPVDIENGIRQCSDRIAASVSECSRRYSTFLAADRAFDQAFAYAYLNADGPAHERKFAAELATAAEREARDVADAAYRYADRLAKALELELRAYQSLSASVRTMYGAVGSGR
jgi:hypothetical protein